MWMKSVPHCKFSDFQPKATFKHPSSIKNEFDDVPNYQLTSKAFDARHLDRFLIRVNENDSINFNNSLMRTEPSVGEKTSSPVEEPVDDGDLVIQQI